MSTESFEDEYVEQDDDILDEESQIVDETKLDIDSDETRGQAAYDDRYTPRRSKD